MDFDAVDEDEEEIEQAPPKQKKTKMDRQGSGRFKRLLGSHRLRRFGGTILMAGAIVGALTVSPIAIGWFGAAAITAVVAAVRHI